jgi:hypothetical protein
MKAQCKIFRRANFKAEKSSKGGSRSGWLIRKGGY